MWETMRSEPDAAYRADACTDLKVADWFFLSSGFAQADTMEFQHPVPGAFPARHIYRVSRQ